MSTNLSWLRGTDGPQSLLPSTDTTSALGQLRATYDLSFVAGYRKAPDAVVFPSLEEALYGASSPVSSTIGPSAASPIAAASPPMPFPRSMSPPHANLGSRTGRSHSVKTSPSISLGVEETGSRASTSALLIQNALDEHHDKCESTVRTLLRDYKIVSQECKALKKQLATQEEKHAHVLAAHVVAIDELRSHVDATKLEQDRLREENRALMREKQQLAESRERLLAYIDDSDLERTNLRSMLVRELHEKVMPSSPSRTGGNSSIIQHADVDRTYATVIKPMSSNPLPEPFELLRQQQQQQQESSGVVRTPPRKPIHTTLRSPSPGNISRILEASTARAQSFDPTEHHAGGDFPDPSYNRSNFTMIRNDVDDRLLNLVSPNSRSPLDSILRDPLIANAVNGDTAARLAEPFSPSLEVDSERSLPVLPEQGQLHPRASVSTDLDSGRTRVTNVGSRVIHNSIKSNTLLEAGLWVAFRKLVGYQLSAGGNWRSEAKESSRTLSLSLLNTDVKGDAPTMIGLRCPHIVVPQLIGKTSFPTSSSGSTDLAIANHEMIFMVSLEKQSPLPTHLVEGDRNNAWIAKLRLFLLTTSAPLSQIRGTAERNYFGSLLSGAYRVVTPPLDTKLPAASTFQPRSHQPYSSMTPTDIAEEIIAATERLNATVLGTSSLAVATVNQDANMPSSPTPPDNNSGSTLRWLTTQAKMHAVHSTPYIENEAVFLTPIAATSAKERVAATITVLHGEDAPFICDTTATKESLPVCLQYNSDSVSVHIGRTGGHPSAIVSSHFPLKVLPTTARSIVSNATITDRNGFHEGYFSDRIPANGLMGVVDSSRLFSTTVGYEVNPHKYLLSTYIKGEEEAALKGHGFDQSQPFAVLPEEGMAIEW